MDSILCMTMLSILLVGSNGFPESHVQKVENLTLPITVVDNGSLHRNGSNNTDVNVNNTDVSRISPSTPTGSSASQVVKSLNEGHNSNTTSEGSASSALVAPGSDTPVNSSTGQHSSGKPAESSPPTTVEKSYDGQHNSLLLQLHRAVSQATVKIESHNSIEPPSDGSVSQNSTANPTNSSDTGTTSVQNDGKYNLKIERLDRTSRTPVPSYMVKDKSSTPATGSASPSNTTRVHYIPGRPADRSASRNSSVSPAESSPLPTVDKPDSQRHPLPQLDRSPLPATNKTQEDSYHSVEQPSDESVSQNSSTNRSEPQTTNVKYDEKYNLKLERLDRTSRTPIFSLMSKHNSSAPTSGST